MASIGVVLQRPDVGGVGEHALRDGRGGAQQHRAPLVAPGLCTGRGPRTTSSGRATTRRTTGSRRPRWARWGSGRRTVGGERQDAGRRRPVAPAWAASAAARARASATIARRRPATGGASSVVASRPSDVARGEVGPERCRRPRGPRSRPGRGRPPRGGGRRRTRSRRAVARARDAVGGLEDEAARRVDHGRAAPANRSPCGSRQVHSGVSSSRPGPASRRCTTPTRAAPCAIASSRSSRTAPRSQRQRGTPSSRSKARGARARAGRPRRRPLVGGQADARSPTTTTASSAASPTLRPRRRCGRATSSPW